MDVGTCTYNCSKLIDTTFSGHVGASGGTSLFARMQWDKLFQSKHITPNSVLARVSLKLYTSYMKESPFLVTCLLHKADYLYVKQEINKRMSTYHAR